MALQIFAYWNALSTRHVLPTRLYCGVSQIGLFGSFHAVHRFTFGSGCAVVGFDGSCCHFGGVQRPLYRSAAAYEKVSRSLESVGAAVRALPPLARPGLTRTAERTL